MAKRKNQVEQAIVEEVVEQEVVTEVTVEGEGTFQVEDGAIVAEVTQAAEKSKKQGIGLFIIAAILADPSRKNEEILKDVLDTFGSKTTYACIAWYRTKLRKEGKLEPRRVTKYVKQFEANAETNGQPPMTVEETMAQA